MTYQIVLVLSAPPIPFGKADSHWYYVLIKELVARGHRVSAFVSCTTAQEVKQTQALFPTPEYEVQCHQVESSHWVGKVRSLRRPYSYIFSPTLCRALSARLSAPYDVLHLEQLWSGWLGLRHRQKAIVTLHYLFSEDRTFDAANTLSARLQGWRSDRAERALLRSYPRFMALSDRLAACARAINPRAVTHTVPLGVDLSYYSFVSERLENPTPVVGLIGNFSWLPSYSAAERLLSRLWLAIKQQVPDAQLHLVGRAAQTLLVGKVGTLPDVTLHQDVPDILPYFRQLDVMLYAPIAGSGMKVKVMEAFALGTAVVTTTEGIEGLPAQDGIHAGICDDDVGLIQRTVELLQNPAQRQTQCVNARHLLEQVCSPQVTVAQVERVYQTIAPQASERIVEVVR